MEDRRTAEANATGNEVHTLVPEDFRIRRTARKPRRAGDLHVCGRCRSELVQPIDWAPADGRRWLVELRCPECGWTSSDVFEQKAVDFYDEVLDRGTEAILSDLATLAQANMEEDVNTFAAALRDDRILPEDF